MGSVPQQLPLPFIVKPSDQWDGDDGNFTSFEIEVGTPPQGFRVFARCSGGEIWVPLYGACAGPLAGVDDCYDLRGIEQSNGILSGYTPNGTSITWTQIGPELLNYEQNLYPGKGLQGLYGTDQVTLGTDTDTGNGTLGQMQLVAGIRPEEFWLGSIGLGVIPSTFIGVTYTTLLDSMKTLNLIPSLSYGYTAGQAYAANPGSLILGGYDQARLPSAKTTVPITGNSTLQLDIQSIQANNALGPSVQNLLSGSITANLDTSTTQLWLPIDVCNAFVDAFGLIYDDAKGYYLVNETIHATLKSSNPTLVFIVGPPGSTTNIQFEYNAFDLNIGIPWYNSSQPYFPLRQAANDSQITLGTAFFQETYIAVDWERGNFTLGQTASGNITQNIIPILPLSATTTGPGNQTSPTSTHTHSPSSNGLQGGAIAGIVVAIIAIAAICAGFAWFFLRRRKNKNSKRHSELEPIQPQERDTMMGYYPPDDKEKPQVKGPDAGVSEYHPAELHDASAQHSPWPFNASMPNTPPAIYELEDPTRINPEYLSSPGLSPGELQGSNAASEMDIHRPTRELPTDQRDERLESEGIEEENTAQANVARRINRSDVRISEIHSPTSISNRTSPDLAAIRSGMPSPSIDSVGLISPPNERADEEAGEALVSISPPQLSPEVSPPERNRSTYFDAPLPVSPPPERPAHHST